MIGHPDHAVLFLASQVAAAAGLKNPKQSATQYRKVSSTEGSLKIKDLGPLVHNLCTMNTYPRWKEQWLIAEGAAYRMLLRGHAPQSEPFRKWVTEEVLPSIRKTGSYDIAKSETPEGLQFAEEFGKLRAEIGMLASEDVLNNLMDTVCVCETT